MKKTIIFGSAILLIASSLLNCKPGSGGGSSSADSLTNVPSTIKINEEYDNIARYIACIPQSDNSKYKGLEKLPLWVEEKNSYDTSWTKMVNSRLKPISEWAKKEIHPSINPDAPVFYPFSGPDFLHAHYMYPNAKEYTMMALEPVGNIPAIEKYSKDTTMLKSYLNYVNTSLKDIYDRSYFITSHMVNDFNDAKAKGVLSVLLVFLKRTNHDIISIQKFAMLSGGKIENYTDANKDSLEKSKIQGVTIEFKPANENVVKKITYYSLDILDKTVDEKYPYFVDHLNNTLKGTNTFLKAASYLMHYETFDKIRKTTLGVSNSILQDDTGIAFHYYNEGTNKDKWNYKLYGKYTKPIASFKGLKIQEDFKKMFDDSTKIKPLPFSLGYHWQDGYQNYMLATKKK